MLRATPPTPGSVCVLSLTRGARVFSLPPRPRSHTRATTHTCTLRNARVRRLPPPEDVPRAISFIATAIRARVRRRSHAKDSSMNQPRSLIRSLADLQRVPRAIVLFVGQNPNESEIVDATSNERRYAREDFFRAR